mgnify:CR=1 FL=1
MREIISEFGPVILEAIAVFALIVLVKSVIGTDATSVVGKAFSDVITGFYTKATSIGGF